MYLKIKNASELAKKFGHYRRSRKLFYEFEKRTPGFYMNKLGICVNKVKVNLSNIKFCDNIWDRLSLLLGDDISLREFRDYKNICTFYFTTLDNKTYRMCIVLDDGVWRCLYIYGGVVFSDVKEAKSFMKMIKTEYIEVFEKLKTDGYFTTNSIIYEL